MRAAVFTGPGSIELQDIETPSAGPGEIVIKVEAATLCGTDLRIRSGAKSAGVVPGTVMGHEIAGRIEQIGEGVEGYEVGRQATVAIVVACNHCPQCLDGREHLCDHLRLFGYAINGGFAEYVLVPADVVANGNVVQATKELPPTHLALAEPLSCCLNAHAQYRVEPGDTVVILGAGPIGLLQLQLAKMSGARNIVVTNRSAGRREVAERLGATHVVSPDDVAAAVAEATGGRGADAVVVCIGANELATTALELARPGGRVNYFAGFSKGTSADVEVNLIHYKELTVTGGSNARRADVVRAVKVLESGVIDGDAIVTHTFSLDDIADAYQAVEDKLGVKIAVTP
ncbi:zinc-binding dehydrogenase [Nigerium massiliense]|uniref:zinc-binding dehydrogenase n=1 Tax=Nigerium massiliense TaxID=1522317 RepID=UPI0005907385|nr:alcohol dehydrogenase catalytic domain-containing protein [Nigerium massiliense]